MAARDVTGPLSGLSITLLSVTALSGFAMGTAHAEPSKGEAIYNSACFNCHGPGMDGAPRLGDQAAWAPRIAQGQRTLYEHALKGFNGKRGTMPAKGGNRTLEDEDVKAAVDYMVNESK